MVKKKNIYCGAYIVYRKVERGEESECLDTQIKNTNGVPRILNTKGKRPKLF